MKQFRWLAPVFFLLFPLVTTASDLAKEQRWADQIVDALIEGEAVWLNADEQRFLSIYTESEEEGVKRAAMILHGIGVHPDWPTVIYPLRTQLPILGWTTLSLQMPVLPNEAEVKDYLPLYDEVPPRIAAGIDYLQEQGIEEIVLIAHSLGASMGSYYLATAEQSPIKAFVSIGMSADGTGGHSDEIGHLQKIAIPILDVYGEKDLPAVVNSAAARKQAGESGSDSYQQIMMPGADHFFEGKGNELAVTVAEWLENPATP
jgi:hypothetical protein